MVSDDRVQTQYRTPSNLETRIAFHERFSTNRYPWMRWVFDQFEIPSTAWILEIGCGVGKLWTDNADRIPPDWTIILSDLSMPMVMKARAEVGGMHSNIHPCAADICEIPLEDDQIDAVIANHMLYYARDLERALSEVRRVLKFGGKFYAATNGSRHLSLIDDLLVVFRGSRKPISSVIQAFNLENGGELLQPFFNAVELHRQPNSLLVDDAEALADFALSLTRSDIPKSGEGEFRKMAAKYLAQHGGSVEIRKDAGMFSASKSG